MVGVAPVDPTGSEDGTLLIAPVGRHAPEPVVEPVPTAGRATTGERGPAAVVRTADRPVPVRARQVTVEVRTAPEVPVGGTRAIR